MKTPRSLLLILCALAWNSASATTVIPPTFDQLVGQAEVIFQGTVTGVTSQWSGEGAQRHIVSYVTFAVEENLKGNAGAQYTLSMLGGTVDGQTMEVTDAPKFAPGDRNILFVENNGRQFVPLVGIMHGYFRVERDGPAEQETVANDEGKKLHNVAALGKDETVSMDAAGPALAAADFKAAIRAQLAFSAK